MSKFKTFETCGAEREGGQLSSWIVGIKFHQFFEK
jgi:hypothetical protein